MTWDDLGRMFSANALLFDCDCKLFKRGVGITFDVQDARELGWKACPFCKKPFRNPNDPNPLKRKDEKV